jgi:hypothetical protein
MKTSNKILLGLFALILITITIIIIKLGVDLKVGSSPEPDIKSGNSEKQCDLPHFNKIEIEGSFIVHYTQDTFQKITVRADSNLIDQVIIEVNYGKLFIHNKKHSRSRHNIDVYVTTDSINEIESKAGSFFKTINQLKVYHVDVSGEAGAKIEMNGDFTNLKIEFNAGSFGDFSGNCKNLDIESSAGAVINSFNMKTDIGKVSCSAGSMVTLNVIKELSIEASAGSIVKCTGNPQIKDINISSGAQFLKVTP